jgi:hypothetical protein
MYGPTANEPLDVCGAVVATFIGNALKDKYIIKAELLQLHPSRRETSSSVISRLLFKWSQVQSQVFPFISS